MEASVHFNCVTLLSFLYVIATSDLPLGAYCSHSSNVSRSQQLNDHEKQYASTNINLFRSIQGSFPLPTTSLSSPSRGLSFSEKNPIISSSMSSMSPSADADSMVNFNAIASPETSFNPNHNDNTPLIRTNNNKVRFSPPSDTFRDGKHDYNYDKRDSPPPVTTPNYENGDNDASSNEDYKETENLDGVSRFLPVSPPAFSLIIPALIKHRSFIQPNGGYSNVAENPSLKIPTASLFDSQYSKMESSLIPKPVPDDSTVEGRKIPWRIGNVISKRNENVSLTLKRSRRDITNNRIGAPANDVHDNRNQKDGNEDKNNNINNNNNGNDEISTDTSFMPMALNAEETTTILVLRKNSSLDVYIDNYQSDENSTNNQTSTETSLITGTIILRGKCNDTSQCFGEHVDCRLGICKCQLGYLPRIDNGDLCGEASAHYVEVPTTDPTMIGVVVGLALMSVTLCIVLRLFAKARFRENRTIFNTPNPRLMNVSLLKGSKTLLRGNSGGGGQRSRRGSNASMNGSNDSPLNTVPDAMTAGSSSHSHPHRVKPSRTLSTETTNLEGNPTSSRPGHSSRSKFRQDSVASNV